MSDDPSFAELIAARPALRADALDGLIFDGVALAALAAAHGTPAWVISAGVLRARARLLRAALPGVALHYAVKANDHQAVLAVMAAEGWGADVVSGGELARALRAGFVPGAIVFSGVGKTGAELVAALAAGIGQINVESAEELHLLAQLAQARGLRAPVSLRVNPDVDAGTHDKISTGREGDKFGVPLHQAAALYAAGAAMPGIDMRGLAVHIGSQILSMAPYQAAYARLAALVRALRGAGLAVCSVDCGGGLGIAYRGQAAPLPQAWAGAIRAAFGGLDVTLAAEPGRFVAAPAGLLLARVVRTRRAGMARPMLVLDAGMNDLLRPAMYEAWHGILPVSAAHLHAPPETADIAGPVCESSDIFARGRRFTALPDGAAVALLDAGAYGAVMSSPYNARPPAAQIMVAEGAAALIRPRPTLESLWSDETVPGFCQPA